MGDFEDMNATPLGKLPLPAVQSKGDGPRVDMSSVSYSDVLKEMNAPAVQAPQQQPMAPPPQQAQYQYPAPMGPPPHMAMNHIPQHHRQAVRRKAPVKHTAPRHKSSGGSGGGGKGVWAYVKAYKSSVLVTLIVFLVLSYVAPKLAQMMPQLLNPMGKFNLAGLLLISTACGGIHRLADHYVKC